MTKDKRAFFILPFGKPDIEKVWGEVYLPVAEALGFDAVRIDERDDGKIKIDQIVNYISTADLIVGDITYERPNCYFELGYARALKQHDEVILCARHDHLDHSKYKPDFFSFRPPLTLTFSLLPSYTPPRIHFDLAGFDVISWETAKLDDFKFKFDRRLKERLTYIKDRAEIFSVAKAESGSPAPPKVVRAAVDLEALAQEFRKKVEQ